MLWVARRALAGRQARTVTARFGGEAAWVNNFTKNLALWVIIGLLLIALFNLFQNPSGRGPQANLAFSDFLAEVDNGRVRDVTIQGNTISGHFSDGRSFSTYAPEDPELVQRLTERGVRITAAPVDDSMPSLLGVLVSWFPMLLLIGVWIFFMRQMQSGGGKAMGFGKSRARLLTEKHGRVTFNDVAGIDEAKEELQEVVEFLKNPQKFQQVGGRIPKGVLLVGPPGTGKTLLARAIAGEANVPFFTISGSDFVEMFVGVGASRVRDMFEQAKKHAPCIVFIDEIDAVGRHRGAGLGGGNDEREQTLNQLLVEMDGFEANEGVILIAATNRPDVLDPALLRPGRFDRQVVVPNPDVLGREKILQVHMKKVRVGPDVDPKVIARGTPGFSGADLANIVNEAALLAARAGKRMVSHGRLRGRQGQGDDGRRAALDGHDRGGEAAHRLSRGGPCPGRLLLPGLRSDPQGDDHPARPRARHGDAPARGRPHLGIAREAERRHRGRHGRPRRRGADLRPRQGDRRRRLRHRAGDQDRAAHGHAVGHERQARADGLRREPAGGVPRPLDHPEQERLRGDRAADRRRDPPDRRRGLSGAKQIISSNLERLHDLANALLEHETLTGEEVGAVLRGEPMPKAPPQEPPSAAAPSGRRGSVPTTAPPKDDTGGMEPSPQPGA